MRLDNRQFGRNTRNNILKGWNAIPENNFIWKTVLLIILSIFSSTLYELFFSEMNVIKSDLRNRLIDNVTYTLLKVTNIYKSIIKLVLIVQQ